MKETITQYLHRMWQKHIDKGERAICGARSTREVADFFGVSVPTARRRLNKLGEAGEVVCLGHVFCAGLEWTVPAALSNTKRPASADATPEQADKA